MRIVVAGTGYVGLSSALLLSQNNEVIVTDILQDRITKLNQGLSPIDDIEIADFLKNKELNFKAALASKALYKSADFVIYSNTYRL